MRPVSAVSLRILAGLHLALLAVVSLLPSGAGPLGGWDASLTPSVQTALHLPAYAVLVLLVAMSLPPDWNSRAVAWLIIAIGSIVFGTLLEWAQANITGRTGSLADALLNTAGVVIGCLAVWWWLRQRTNH